mgnify:CR=1 FL=1
MDDAFGVSFTSDFNSSSNNNPPPNNDVFDAFELTATPPTKTNTTTSNDFAAFNTTTNNDCAAFTADESFAPFNAADALGDIFSTMDAKVNTKEAEERKIKEQQKSIE